MTLRRLCFAKILGACALLFLISSTAANTNSNQNRQLAQSNTAQTPNKAIQLQGNWMSLDDPKETITIVGQQWISKYQNEGQMSNDFALTNNCLDFGGDIDTNGNFIVFPDDRETCLVIVKLSENELTLSLIGRGNTLRYIRKDSALQELSKKSQISIAETGLIPSELNECKPIPAKWKPGTKVYNEDFAKHHPRYKKGVNTEGFAHAIMRQHCIWVQKIGGFDWRVVAGKNAVFAQSRSGAENNPNYRVFNHKKQGPLDIKEAVFAQSPEVKSKPIYNFVRYNNGRWHGTIEYLKSLGNDQYLVLVSYWKGDRPGLIKAQCEIQENGDSFHFTACGRPIMRPQYDYASMDIVKGLRPNKRMPDGSFGSLKSGTFSVLKNTEHLPIWKSTLGPIAVLRDDPETSRDDSHFAGKFSEHANGVIRMWTKDGKKYTGYWARKCRGYTAFDKWWSEANNTGNTRDYQTCHRSKKARAYKKKGWSAQYPTLDGEPSSCWGSIIAFKEPSSGTFNGYIKECAVGQSYEFSASMGSIDAGLEQKRRELAELKARRAQEEERLRLAEQLEAEKRRLAEAEARRAQEEERLRLAEQLAAEKRRLAEAEARRAQEEERLRLAEQLAAEKRRLAEAEARRALIASLQKGTVAETFGGEVWESTWGPVVVAVDAYGRFTARYNDEAMGWIALSSDDGFSYRGYWARNCGQREPGCGSAKTSRDGIRTQCWGHLWGQVNDANNKFRGSWNYCGTGETGDWNGWK